MNLMIYILRLVLLYFNNPLLLRIKVNINPSGISLIVSDGMEVSVEL